MSLFQAIVLGIVQGLTEFLPVSSSGHLELVKVMFGENLVANESMMFTVVLHFATALSTVVIYRKDIAEIIKGLFQFKNNNETIFSLNIVLSMIPAAAVGVLFNDEIEALFDGQVLLVGAMLIVTGLLLFLSDRAKSTTKEVTSKSALIVGVSQAIAILPGISRSGATIATSVLLGIDKGKAARFSFLMVVPLILGKMAKDLLDADGQLLISDESLIPLLVGFTTAFVTGLIACNWMISLVKKAKLAYFSYYCFAVGSLALVYSLIQ